MVTIERPGEPGSLIYGLLFVEVTSQLVLKQLSAKFDQDKSTEIGRFPRL